MIQTLKRLGLFLGVNFLVVITVSLVLNLLGIQPYLTEYGIDVRSMAIFCLIWGIAGSLISLFLSKAYAVSSMGVSLIARGSSNPQEKKLLDFVNKLSRQACLKRVPELGIYPSLEVNAFATGPTKGRALIAVSSSLLQKMDEDEIEGILGHEITHISNGDMVTMTLLQGVINSFVMFFARAIAFIIISIGGEPKEKVNIGKGFSLLILFFEIFFMFFGMILIAWFSRKREFKADEGAATFAGRGKIVGALTKLQYVINIQDPRDKTYQVNFQIFKITSPNGWFKLFATHPPP